jgi:hypothetical protein
MNGHKNPVFEEDPERTRSHQEGTRKDSKIDGVGILQTP